MKKLLALAPVILLVAACGKSEIGHDDAYYEAHPAERNAKVKECNNTPDATNPECLAANRVAAKHQSLGTPFILGQPAKK
ncbi:hypothetical protein VI06_10535 [Aquitalea magnusonii]|nr:hypothetical protein VI06_10535 [Aquitalea magnusonii]